MTPTQNNDDELPTVFIIVGRVWENESGGGEEAAVPVNILLRAPDDDSAVRQALEHLAAEGYVEAEFDQIGVLTEEPDNPTYEAAYQDALEGNVAVIAFHD
ncbi:regulator [Rhizobiales bacterium]|uniref:regulator n=1 Tax=Hongsoonwoonella zoysiae TaxID=2821844 RepID=UPI0015612F21|nr:regulator [Hongsoonwoonella zoysiae]NRG20010.1 regulator [Hongsoonwoonella zoysiae]